MIDIGIEERIEQPLALDWPRLRAAHSRPWPPDTREGCQRPFLVEREPDRRFARLGIGILCYMDRQALRVPGRAWGDRSYHQAQIVPCPVHPRGEDEIPISRVSNGELGLPTQPDLPEQQAPRQAAAEVPLCV